MVWTAPHTWKAGETDTAALMNAEVRDNLNGSMAALATTAGDTFHATAATTLARLAVGSAGQFYQLASGVPSWVTSPAPMVRAAVAYNPASTATYTISSTSFADVDATNLVATFTAPTSGIVAVELCCLAKAAGNTNGSWNLRDAGGDIAGTGVRAVFYSSAAQVAFYRMTSTIVVTGLTGGSSYTWKWGASVDSGSMTMKMGRTTPEGPATMIMWAG